MRCKACDTLLTDKEARRKDAETGEFVDLCGECYYASQAARYNLLEDEFIYSIAVDTLEE